MSLPNLRPALTALVVAMAVVLPEPTLAAGGKPMIPIAGGFSAAPSNDAEVRAAVAAAVAELRGPTWLGRADLAAGPVRSAERQVVAGMNYRVAFELKDGGRVRPARAQVWHDLQGKRHLSWAVIGEPGAAEVDGATPTSTNGLPGGWSDQDPKGASIAARAKRALALLAGADWLGHAPGAPKVQEAKMQVVAGFNTWLAIDATVGGKPRRIDLEMYESPQDEASLSWVRLEPR